MKKLKLKNHKRIFGWLVIAGFILSFGIRIYSAYGALSCSITTAAACVGTAVLRMSDTTNAQAELPAQSNNAYTNNVVCCTGVSGLGTSCSGNFGIVAKLSAVTNAHSEQGTLSNYAQSACLSAPGAVSIGYQPTNCTGFDTTLASMSATTNAQVGIPTAYTNKICATATSGTLSSDIVDAGGSSVASPSVLMSAASLGFGCQTTTGTLGSSSQKIRVTNSTGNNLWTLSVAGSAATALWDQGANHFDFNDPTTSGCADGPDTDTYAGQMSANAGVATITPQAGCSSTGVSLGTVSSFSETGTVVSSIGLAAAGGTSSTNCYWDFTGINVSQNVPAEQLSSTYSTSLVVSIVSN